MTAPLDLTKFEGHTPGPYEWFTFADGLTLADERGCILAEVPKRYLRGGKHNRPAAEIEATLELFKAAPQLLARVRELEEERERLRALLDIAHHQLLDLNPTHDQLCNGVCESGCCEGTVIYSRFMEELRAALAPKEQA